MAALHHTGLTVGDLDRSVAFYGTLLGLREIGRAELAGDGISTQTGLDETEIDVALLAGSNTVLELLCYRSPPGETGAPRACDVGAAHVCLVVDDLQATHERMQAAGVEFHARPTVLTGSTRMVYVRDPDGIMVELIQPDEELGLAALLARPSTVGAA